MIVSSIIEATASMISESARGADVGSIAAGPFDLNFPSSIA